jgi:hypothetical protein
MESVTIAHLKRRAMRTRQASVRTVEQRLRYAFRMAWTFTPCQFFRRLGREVSLHRRLPYLLRQLAMHNNAPVRPWRPCSEPLPLLLHEAPSPQIFDKLSHKEHLLLIICQRRLSHCSRAYRLSDMLRSALALPIRRLEEPYSTRQRLIQRFGGSAACMFSSLRGKMAGAQGLLGDNVDCYRNAVSGLAHSMSLLGTNRRVRPVHQQLTHPSAPTTSTLLAMAEERA